MLSLIVRRMGINDLRPVPGHEACRDSSDDIESVSGSALARPITPAASRLERNMVVWIV